MVPVVFKEQVDDAAAGAGDGVARAEDKAGDAGVDYRAGTHRAGLERHIHRAALEPPAAKRGPGLADSLDLGVGGRIAQLLAAVASAADDAAGSVRDHAADRHLAVLRRLARKVKGEGHIDLEITRIALAALNIDSRGLDQMDNKILGTIIEKFNGGPVGLNTVATAVGEEAGTIEEVYEPFLIKEGFLKRTPRGREATPLAYQHLGFTHPRDGEASLF